MKKFKAHLGLLLLLGIFTSPVYAAVALIIVDFEDVTVDGSYYRSTEIISEGFKFVQTNATQDWIGVVKDPDSEACGGCVNTNPTQYGYVYNEDPNGPFEVVITAVSGDDFDLDSFELASLYPTVPSASAKLQVLGTPSNGGAALFAEVDFDNIPDNFQLIEFGPEWSDLSTVKISSNELYPAFDDFKFVFTSPGVIASTGSLEIPPEGGNMSGVSIVSGWHCSATNIEVSFDGGELIKAASGTTRGDTEGICGEGNINTGYSLLWAYSLLAEGEHTATVYADGLEFDSATFNVTLINGEQFVVGASGQWSLENFPVPGNNIAIEWSEASQGFTVTDSGN